MDLQNVSKKSTEYFEQYGTRSDTMARYEHEIKMAFQQGYLEGERELYREAKELVDAFKERENKK